MPSVLIVDDEPSVLRLLSLVLRSAEFQIRTAEDGAAALDLLKDWRPDIVLADVRMPGIDGVELARRVKSSPELAAMPFLLMSAMKEPREHRADGFLAKPLDVD